MTEISAYLSLLQSQLRLQQIPMDSSACFHLNWEREKEATNEHILPSKKPNSSTHYAQLPLEALFHQTAPPVSTFSVHCKWRTHV